MGCRKIKVARNSTVHVDFSEQIDIMAQLLIIYIGHTIIPFYFSEQIDIDRPFHAKFAMHHLVELCSHDTHSRLPS